MTKVLISYDGEILFSGCQLGCWGYIKEIFHFPTFMVISLLSDVLCVVAVSGRVASMVI